MTRLVRSLEAVARAAVFLAFLGLMLVVVLQLLGRSSMIPAQVWTEEAARYALLFIAAFGAGLALRSGDLVNVDLVCESLPGRWPWRLRLVSMALSLGLVLALLRPAWTYTAIGVRQTSPALGIRMDWIHGSVLVLLVGLGLFAALRIIAMLTGAETGLAAKSEEDN